MEEEEKEEEKEEGEEEEEEEEGAWTKNRSGRGGNKETFWMVDCFFFIRHHTRTIRPRGS